MLLQSVEFNDMDEKKKRKKKEKKKMLISLTFVDAYFGLIHGPIWYSSNADKK